MNRRILSAAAALAIALPLQAVQLTVLFHGSLSTALQWPQLLVANLALLAGACCLGFDFPLAGRMGRAYLVGVGVPLLLPGPTVLDSLIRASNPGLDIASLMPYLIPSVVLLLLLGGAEAVIYLMATKPETL